ncbi:hypothetical protein LSTR_LSTR010415 [Laodelphax striatellus]|uniref:ABC transporter domain-containing protein n=1 Tax=Laodelphax striatellus TaxID=195883 RepID=A0A482XJ12_LAOST|nr:hypothetical protein LSTR_LSTR010415 [Laodelphax striatellus]
MDVEFEDLTVRVNSNWFKKESGRRILKGVSGKFKAGQLSAILGPSGAGKSSLLNAISGYRSQGVSGRLKLNGVPGDEARFRKMSCYIQQEDLLQPMLTLQEVMNFAALLKLPPGTSYKQRRAVINDIQGILGLIECRHTRTEALSGGQKKRLSIALELINNPPVLFLDEPTSGLDNVSTSYTLRLLRTLAHQGRTIVCTIHQPSASLFQMFDHVYVLASGLCVYQGVTGELVPFLSSVGLHCPRHYNPADFVIEMTDGEDEDNIKRLSTAIKNGKVVQLTSADAKKTIPDFTNLPIEGLPIGALPLEEKIVAVPGYGEKYVDMDNGICITCRADSSAWLEFCTLFRRMFLQIMRNKTGLKIQFYHHLVCSLAVGIVFWGKARDGNQFFNHMKFCMGIILFHAYTQCMVPVLTFPFEVKLLKKEHFNRWYRLTPYYMALQLSKVPTMTLFSQLFLTIVYVMSGLPLEFYRFFVFSVVGVMTAFVAEGWGLAIGSVFNVTNGSAVGPMTIAPFLGFAIYGFDFARDIPAWFMPILKLSFLRSGVIALIIVVFGMNRGFLDCNHEMYCHFKNPRIIIYYLDIEGVSPWQEIAGMFAMLLFFRIVCFFGLKWRLRT